MRSSTGRGLCVDLNLKAIHQNVNIGCCGGGGGEGEGSWGEEVIECF